MFFVVVFYKFSGPLISQYRNLHLTVEWYGISRHSTDSAAFRPASSTEGAPQQFRQQHSSPGTGSQSERESSWLGELPPKPSAPSKFWPGPQSAPDWNDSPHLAISLAPLGSRNEGRRAIMMHSRLRNSRKNIAEVPIHW